MKHENIVKLTKISTFLQMTQSMGKYGDTDNEIFVFKKDGLANLGTKIEEIIDEELNK